MLGGSAESALIWVYEGDGEVHGMVSKNEDRRY